MKTVARIIALAVLILLSARIAADEDVMGNAPLIIPHQELPTVRREALEGSPDAAQRLYMYYSAIALNPSEAFYWAQVAAENGSAIGQYTLGFELLKRKDQESAIRGRFWMRRAAKEGHSRAQGVLRDLEKDQ